MHIRRPIAAIAAIVALVAASTSSGAEVRVVAPSGAPYTTIGAAVAAASQGDVILVKPGAYPGFTVDAKTLAVVADPEGGAAITSRIFVRNLGVNQRVSIAGLVCECGDLAAISNAGSLRLEAVTTIPETPFGTDAHGFSAIDCADVAVVRCALRGGDAVISFSNPGAGVYARGSNLAVHDSTLVGGRGRPGMPMGSHWIGGSDGGDGCRVDAGARVWLAGCSALGGPGVDAPTFGGVGVRALPGGEAYARDLAVQGGVGPAGAAADAAGAVTILPGARRTMRCATHAREDEQVLVALRGEPGDRVWIHDGHLTAWQLELPFDGVRLIGPYSRRIALGTIPGDGVLYVGLRVPEIGAGIPARVHQLQAFFRDVAGGSHHASAAAFVALDSAQ